MMCAGQRRRTPSRTLLLLLLACAAAAVVATTTTTTPVLATECAFATQRVQCGDLACDAATHKCVRCRRDADCYPGAMRCNAAEGVCEVKKLTHMINGYLVIAVLGAFVVCAVGVIAGVGGGGILVPMFTPLLELPMVSAVALSQSTICGQTVLNMYFAVQSKHPDTTWERPLINYQYLSLLLPLGLIGTLLGSVLNTICPDFVRLLLLFTLFTAVLVRTIKKTRRQFRADKAAAAAAVAPTTTTTTAMTSRDVTIEAAAAPSETTAVVSSSAAAAAATAATAAAHHANYNAVDTTPPAKPAPPRSSQAAAADDDAEAAGVRPPAAQYPVLELTTDVACFVVLLMFNVLRARTACGGAIYWVSCLAPLLFLAGVFYSNRTRLRSLAREQPEQMMFAWNRNTSVVFPLVAVVAGAAAAMLGIGGGLVMGFVMYEIGLGPEETSMTSGAATFFIAFSSGLQLLASGKLQFDYGVVFFFVGMASTALGQLVIMRYIKEHGMLYLIVASLALVVAVSLIILGVYGIVNAVQTTRAGGSIFSLGHLCQAA